MKKPSGWGVPILLALGLWLVGNEVLSSGPARGQEVASNDVQCVVTYLTDYISHCPPRPVGGKCTGNWQYIEYQGMTCTGPPDMSPCSSASHGPVSGTSYSGYCFTNSTTFPTNTYCQQGPTVYSVPATENNPAWCSNGPWTG